MEGIFTFHGSRGSTWLMMQKSMEEAKLFHDEFVLSSLAADCI